MSILIHVQKAHTLLLASALLPSWPYVYLPALVSALLSRLVGRWSKRHEAQMGGENEDVRVAADRPKHPLVMVGRDKLVGDHDHPIYRHPLQKGEGCWAQVKVGDSQVRGAWLGKV